MSMVKSLAAIGLAAVLAWTAPAAATVSVSVSDGITTLSCADGAACDVNPVAGIVTFVYVVGSWAGSVATGASDSPVPFIDLTGSTRSMGAGTLTMLVSDVDFTLGGAAALSSFFADIGGTQPSPGSVAYSMWVDDANGLFAMADLIGTGSKVGTPFSDLFTGSDTVGGTFSMTLGVVVKHGMTSFTSFDFEGKAVPEPGTLALLGAGLVGLATLRRRNALD